MNNRTEKPIDSKKQNTAAMAIANKMIKRQNEAKERGAQIINYYTNRQQNDRRI